MYYLQSNLLCRLTNMSCRLPENDFPQGGKHVAKKKPIIQFLECNILNENAKFFMISAQDYSLL